MSITNNATLPHLKGFISYHFVLHSAVETLTYRFPCITSKPTPTYLLTSNRASIIFFFNPLCYIILNTNEASICVSKLTTSAHIRSCCVIFSFKPSWFSWTFLMVYSHTKGKRRASPYFRTF